MRRLLRYLAVVLASRRAGAGDDGELAALRAETELAALRAENAQLRDSLNASCYVQRYADLRAVFCDSARDCDLERAKAHWVEHGEGEGRAAASPGSSSAAVARRRRRVLYRVDERGETHVEVLAVRERDRRGLAASNEWLSLLKKDYYDDIAKRRQFRPYFAAAAELYASLAAADAAAATPVDSAVVPLVTSFATGTVHGFTGFWLILMDLVDRRAAGETILIVPCEWHSYWDAPPVVALRLSAFVHRHFVDRGAPVPGNRTVAILKTAAGSTSQGVLCPDRVAAILRKHRAELLDPAALGEIALINALAAATTLVVSWGTTSMKNYVDVGGRCTDIYVHYTADFAGQANNPSARRSTFRNATIHDVAAEDLVSHSHHHHREGPPDVTIKWVFKKSGEAIETPAYFGENLLRLAQRHDIPLEGACEGVTACSTCHCILEDDFFDELEEELEEDEEDMLDQAFGLTPTSRLGCQLKVDERFDGAVIMLPEATRLLARRRKGRASLLRAAAGEARVLEILGDGRLSLGRDEEAELETLIANLPASTPSVEALRGDWRLLYTSKSAFDASNPLGKRVDGTAPGVEGAFDALFGGSGAAASSSPIQRFLTGLESVDIAQNIELSDDGATGRVDQLVEGGDGSRLRLSAAGSLADSGRINFAFDLAYFEVFGRRLPYPVPFKLLGDEAKGYLDTPYVSEGLRVSTGNKGTTFILGKGTRTPKAPKRNRGSWPTRRPRRAPRARRAKGPRSCRRRSSKLRPASDDLLDGDLAQLEGRWSLVATVAGRAAGEDERLAETGIAGAVNASGIVVDAGAERKPVQEIRGGRIANEVRVDLPLFGGAWVRVAGGLEKGANGRRANVEFDSLEFFDETSGQRVFRAAWPFKLVKQFRPSLTTGADDVAWLETTYLSDDVRVGRGNKGSVFFLTRTDEPCPLTPADF
ncbi:hypothetical protein JL722_6990 [Aureococcus anophagefferens]|nr:hypothetical protein JL722_6990 [Aureococcus anophagefferens]